MLRRRVIAVLLALSSAAALTFFELLGSPLYLTKFSLLPPLALLIGLGLAGLHELVHPGAPITARLRRIRGGVYLWQAAMALSGLIQSVNVQVELLRDNPDFPILPGADEALYFLYVAMVLDFVVLRPLDVWFGAPAPPAAPTP
jgi:hypothetical protein